MTVKPPANCPNCRGNTATVTRATPLSATCLRHTLRSCIPPVTKPFRFLPAANFAWRVWVMKLQPWYWCFFFFLFFLCKTEKKVSVYYLSKHIWNVALVQRDTICLWVSAAVTSHKFKAVNFSCKDQQAEDLIHSLVQFERIPRDQHKEANWEQWRVCFCSYTFDKWRVCISGNGKGFFQSDVCLSSKRDNTVPFAPSRPLVSCTSHFSDNSHASQPRAIAISQYLFATAHTSCTLLNLDAEMKWLTRNTKKIDVLISEELFIKCKKTKE